MKADMSEQITGAAIPDDVMKEAVRAVDDMLFGPESMPDELRNAEIRAALEAALPILTPAIQEDLIELMTSEAQRSKAGVYFPNDHPITLEWWLEKFLPTEDEEKK